MPSRRSFAEWQRRFDTRVDESTQNESVMAKVMVSEQLHSPLGDAPVEEENLLPEAILSKLISEIYKEKAAFDHVMDGGEPSGKTLTEFVNQKYLRKFGLKKIADENMHWLIASIGKWRDGNRKVYNFGRFCGMYNVLSTDALLFYLTFIGVCKEQHGKDFTPEWLGTPDRHPFHIAPEVAMRSVRVVFDFLPAERLQQVSLRVTQLIRPVHSKNQLGQGTDEQMIDFDLLSEIVIEEQKTEITRNMRYLEAVFNAADVDGDGVLTFDEFAEMVRRVEPNLSTQRASALFADCLHSSGGDAIKPSAFADCAIRNGLLKTKATGKPTSKLSFKESQKVLKELCQKISLEGLEEEDLAKLQPVVDELNQLAHVKLLGGEEKKESEKKVDRAWMLYQHVTAELALLASRKRTGEKTSHGGLVRSESLYFDTVEEEDAPRAHRQQVQSATMGRRKQVAAKKFVAPEGWVPPVYEKAKEEEEFLMTTMGTNKLMKNLAPSDREQLMKAFKKVTFEKDSEIITQGKEGDSFFILYTGQCDISVKGKGTVMKATKGVAFGELALLQGAPRAATVTAEETVEAWELDEVSFKMILMGKGKKE